MQYIYYTLPVSKLEEICCYSSIYQNVGEIATQHAIICSTVRHAPQKNLRLIPVQSEAVLSPYPPTHIHTLYCVTMCFPHPVQDWVELVLSWQLTWEYDRCVSRIQHFL